MVRYTTFSDKGRKTLHAETNWWLNTQALEAGYNNLRNFFKAIDEIRSMLDRQISFNTLFSHLFGMKLDINLGDFPTLTSLYIQSILKNIDIGKMMIRVDLYEAFLRMNMLPQLLREEIIRLASVMKDIADKLVQLALSTLYDIFTNDELKRLFEQIYDYLSDLGKMIYDNLMKFLNDLKYWFEDLIRAITNFFGSSFGTNMEKTRLRKAVYGRTRFDYSYYDPDIFRQILSKTWEGYVAKDFSLVNAREWFRITKEQYVISDKLTNEMYDRAANFHAARVEALFADYGWADVTTTGPEGVEPKLAKAGLAILSLDTLDYENRSIFIYKTEMGREGWYGRSTLGFVRLSNETTLELWPTHDHRPTTKYSFTANEDPTLYAEASRATDVATLGWVEISFTDLANFDTEQLYDNVYAYDPWDMPVPLHITNTYVSLANVNLPTAVAGLSASEGPTTGMEMFRHSSVKDYAMPYSQRVELEALAQKVVKITVKDPKTVHLTMATDAILQLFAMLTNPQRKWQYDSFRSMAFDEAIKYWKKYWSEQGLPNATLDELLKQAYQKLKAYQRSRLLQKLRSRYYRKWNNP